MPKIKVNRNDSERKDELSRFIKGHAVLISFGIAILSLVIPIFQTAKDSPGGIYLLIGFICFVGAVVLFIGRNKWKKRILQRVFNCVSWVLVVACVVLSVYCFWLSQKHIEVVKDPLKIALVQDSLANSLIIVPRLGRWSVSDDIQCDILRKQNDGTWVTERSIPIEKREYIIARTLKPGLYRVELTLYGVRQDLVEDLYVGPQKGNYVELTGRGFVGCLKFHVIKKDGTPLENTHVVLYTHKDFPFRDDDTDATGETHKMWVSSVLYDGDYYYAKAYYPGETGFLVGQTDKIIVRYGLPGKVKTVQIKTNVE